MGDSSKISKIKRRIYCKTCSEIRQKSIYHTNYCEKCGKVCGLTASCYKAGHIKYEMDYYGAERLMSWIMRSLYSDLERIKDKELKRLELINLRIKNLLIKEENGKLTEIEKDSFVERIDELRQERMYYQDRISVNILALRSMLDWADFNPKIIAFYCEIRELDEKTFRDALKRKITNKLLLLEKEKD